MVQWCTPVGAPIGGFREDWLRQEWAALSHGLGVCPGYEGSKKVSWIQNRFLCSWLTEIWVGSLHHHGQELLLLPALFPSQDEPLLPEVLCVKDSVAVAREETNEGLNISQVPIILEFLWCLQFCLSCSQQWQWIGPSGGSRMLFWVYSVVRFLLSSCFWHEQSLRAERHAGKGHGYWEQNIDCSTVGAVKGGVRPHMG